MASPWSHVTILGASQKTLSQRLQNVLLFHPTNLSSIKEKLAGKHTQFIQLVELHLPTLPELPPEYHTTKSLPPQLMPKLKEAFEMAKPNFSKILEKLKPDLLICDLSQPWVPATATEHNIPAVEFITTSAAMASFMLHVTRDPDADFPFPEIYLREYEKDEIAHMKESSSYQECIGRSCDMILIKTFREIEGKYFDFLSFMLKKKIVPVGPLVEDTEQEHEGKYSSLTDWLNKKEPRSTVFACFGSELCMSKEQIEELGHGLELSNVNFLWVIRFQKGEKMRVKEALPEGFLERVGERGMVVEGWAPQAKILEHESVGGFVSHCGWSSAMEALKCGVPIVAIPIVQDEPINARLLEHIGVGVEAVKDEYGKIQRTEVAKVIKQVMMEETGESLRTKAKLLSDHIRNNGGEQIDGLVQDLVKLYKSSNRKIQLHRRKSQLLEQKSAFLFLPRHCSRLINVWFYYTFTTIRE